MATKPVPDGYGTVTPFVMSSDGNRMITFLQDAFGAEVLNRMDGPNGSLWHAEVRVGSSIIMLGDGNESWPAAPASFYVYVEDCDAVYRQALEAGGESLREPTDEFYGDRSAGVKDPTGNQWWIATHVEDVAPDELVRRRDAAIAQMSAS